MRSRDDEGTILLLTIGLCAVLLLLVAVVVDVSKVVLARRALSAAADGAAVAAAQQADRESIVAHGLGDRVPLDPAAVADVVAQYEEEAREEQPGLQLVGSVDPEDAGTALVRASRTVTLPFVGWLGVAKVQLDVAVRAQAPVLPSG
ncbi:MAG: pilus assembly protein TadG-related protein [Mycobacteriales bacterium]